MKSCIYSGWITHRRFFPILYKFRYRHYFYYLDLDELPNLLTEKNKLLKDKWWLPTFARNDHIAPQCKDIKRVVKQEVKKHLALELHGPIRMLSQLRTFGTCFNPLTLYYCFDEQGDELQAIVAHVSNTPWGEKHIYVLDPNGFMEHEKTFHVSPLLPMTMKYKWNVPRPADELRVGITLTKNDKKWFKAVVNTKKMPLNLKSIKKLTLKQPAIIHQTFIKIYWQALKLYLRGAKFYNHPIKQGRKNDK